MIDTHKLAYLFAALCSGWKLTHGQIKTLTSLTDYQIACILHDETTDLNEDQISNMAMLLRIHINLKRLFESTDQALAWVHKHNSEFSNKTALQYMLEDKDNVARIVLYLEQIH